MRTVPPSPEDDPGTRAGVVLALRALGLGDALTGVPALRGLRRAFPGAHLVLAGPSGPGALLRRRGVVDDVLPVDGVAAIAEDAVVAAAREHPAVLPPGWPVVAAVNLHGRGPQSALALRGLLDERGADGARLLGHACPAAGLDGPAWSDDLPEVERWASLVRATTGAPCGPDDLRLDAAAWPTPLAPERTAPGPAEAARPGRTVVLHPGAASASRRWPASSWTALAAALVAGGRDVVLTGSAAEADVTAEVAVRARAVVARSGPTSCVVVDTAGRCDLEQLAGLLAGARALVCGDTGVAHLATALATPSVLLFGPTSPAAWGPAVDHHLHPVLWPAPSATYRGDPHGAHVDPVLARTTVDDVLGALADLPARRAA